jgi:hypothetical protein
MSFLEIEFTKNLVTISELIFSHNFSNIFAEKVVKITKNGVS